MITVPRAPRPRPTAARLAVAALSTVVLFGAGATSASAAPFAAPPAAATSPAPPVVPHAFTGPAAAPSATSGPALVRTARSTSASDVCGKRLWTTRYLRSTGVKRFVITFVMAVRSASTPADALGAAATAARIGTPSETALGVLAGVDGNLITTAVGRLPKSFERYSKIRFQLQARCVGPMVFPKLSLIGVRKV